MSDFTSCSLCRAVAPKPQPGAKTPALCPECLINRAPYLAQQLSEDAAALYAHVTVIPESALDPEALAVFEAAKETWMQATLQPTDRSW